MTDLRQFKPREGRVSYDLGWLLQNQKVSDEDFCSFLLGETCAEIEGLVSRIFQSPADRIAVVDQIVFSILVRRRSYKSNISGKAWLYRLILDECLQRTPHSPSTRAFGFQQLIPAIDTRLTGKSHYSLFLNSLTEEQRLFVILHYGQKLSPEEIALLLKRDLDLLHTDLQQSQQKLIAHQRSCEECSSLSSSLASMETALGEALHPNSHLMDTAHENNTEWARSLLERLHHKKFKAAHPQMGIQGG